MFYSGQWESSMNLAHLLSTFAVYFIALWHLQQDFCAHVQHLDKHELTIQPVVSVFFFLNEHKKYKIFRQLGYYQSKKAHKF